MSDDRPREVREMPPGSLHGPVEVIKSEYVGIKEAGELLNLNPRTIRYAIKRGELPAHLIGGRDAIRAGRGLGYRISRHDLQAWFFGKVSVE